QKHGVINILAPLWPLPSSGDSQSTGGNAMPSSPRWVFGPFRLDPANACLWHGAEGVVLPPQNLYVLPYLVPPPDRLVTKDELLDAVWSETAVTDAVVRNAIGILRRVLGDMAQTPRFI